MSYRTKAAEELIDKIQTASAMNADKAKKADDTYSRGLYTGWADALTFAAEVLTDNLRLVELEAETVPEYDFLSEAERIAAETWESAA